ncbi:MAG: DUF4129 domain-containing protein [Deltaproteobacteria bacterium]|nr:DUF4129 domain-containing protein [Deltaproteobacteria bacterium]
MIWCVPLAILITICAIPQVVYKLRSLLEMFLQARAVDEPGLQHTTYLPDPPEWLVLAVSLCVSVLILRMAITLWRRPPRRHRRIEYVAREAQRTLKELRAGADLREGVIRCYYEMSRVLDERYGLKRHQAMTTREFEQYLEQEGIPEVYIERLTQLFEMVRYGAKRLGEPEEREAVACLTAIVRASEGSV